MTSYDEEVTIDPAVIRYGSDSSKEALFSLTVTQNLTDTTTYHKTEASVKFELIGSNSKNYKLNRTSYTFDITKAPISVVEDEASKDGEAEEEETFFKLISVKVTDRAVH